MPTPPADDALLGIARHLGVVTSAPDRAFLFSEAGVTRLSGGEISQVVSLLDGTRTLAGVLADAPGTVDPQRVRSIVGSLRQAGLVVARPAGCGDGRGGAHGEPGYWDALGVPVPAPGVVDLLADEGPARTALEAAVRAAGLGVAGTGGVPGDPGLTVALCDDYLDPGLVAVDEEHRSTGRVWMPAVIVGMRLWVGPVLEPGRPGCWRCLSARLRRHRLGEELAAASGGLPAHGLRPAVCTQATVGLGANLVAQEAANWLAGHRHDGQRAVLTMDTAAMRVEHHPAPVDPECPTCGSPAVRAEGGPVLEPRRALAEDYRAVPAREVYERYRHLVSPVTGIVKRVEVAAGTGGAGFRSGPHVGADARDLDALRTVLRRSSGGKGESGDQARTGALCEALERHSGELRDADRRVYGSLCSLGPDALDPRQVLLFSEQQYRDRERINRTCAPQYAVPRPFDPGAEMDWSPIWSMTRGREVLLPTELLYYGAPPTSGGSVRTDSNGCAAGSSAEEAVLYGLLELVERDAVSTWWYNRLDLPGIDLDSFGSAWVDGVRTGHAELGREVWALDATSDTGVPVVVALSARPGAVDQGVAFGFGAHVDPRRALSAALAEVDQMLPRVAAPDGGPADSDLDRWRRDARLGDCAFLRPARDVAPRTRTDLPSPATGDLARDVDLVRGRLEEVGCEVLVLDQTRPDVGLPVYRVVVPGLRPLAPRFAAGRLFEVPVAQGRSTRVPAVTDLNPTPMFL